MERMRDIGDSKENILIDEIIRYLPSLSIGTKINFIKLFHRNICEEYCDISENCVGCPIGYSACRQIEEIQTM